MAPNKRALADADANEQRPAKRISNAKDASSPENGAASSDSGTNADADASWNTDINTRSPYIYMTIVKPYYANDDENDSDDDEEEEQEGPEDDEQNKSESGVDKSTNMFNKLAADHPEWPYTIMTESWRKLVDYNKIAAFTNPDRFGMYVDNDFHWYGLLELIENMVIDFNKAHKKNDLEHMWSTISTLGNWLNMGDHDSWLMCDDGERTEHTFDVIGAALLTVLEAVDRAGELKKDSKFRDLSFVMALFLKSTISPAEIPLEEGLDWRSNILGYAKKAGIDLKDSGCEGIDQPLEVFKDMEALQTAAEGDRWQWTKKFKALEKSNGSLGGEQHNILKWSRADRAEAAFDKKDPLKEFSAKDLKEGNIGFA